MLCGTCLHDNTLGAALIAAGHEVAVLPTYTPLRTDEASVVGPRVFYGALNVYLEQSSALFRAVPRRWRGWLDRPGLLDWVARFSGATAARGLGALTLSMVRGEDGHQRAELAQLVAWLRDAMRPDVVHLSNSLFLGMARSIREGVGAPVVVALSGEDLFIESLEEPYRARVIGELRARAADADALVAPSGDYAERMAELLAVPPQRLRIARLGLNLEGFPSPAAVPPDGPVAAGDGTPAAVRLGFLARQCPEKGLHLLVEAFHLLRTMPDLPPVELHVAGYLGARDRRYVEELRERVQGWGLGEVVHWHGELDRPAKIAFLRSLDVFSVPTVYREAKGLSVLEAMAAGVPVVQPRHGSFPWLVQTTGGGVLVDPESAGALSRGLRSLVLAPERRRELGRLGREGVFREYSAAAMVRDNVAIYDEVLASWRARQPGAALGRPRPGGESV
jgi:glycosyltransferase involved in cell wall biosynthesis